MSKYNVDLMLEIKAAIESNPTAHDQKYWVRDTNVCGTTRCIAGWAIHLAGGYELMWSTEQFGNDSVTVADFAYGASGVRYEIADLAAAEMGLNEDEMYDLFWTGDNEGALAKLDELIEKGKNQ